MILNIERYLSMILLQRNDEEYTNKVREMDSKISICFKN